MELFFKQACTNVVTLTFKATETGIPVDFTDYTFASDLCDAETGTSIFTCTVGVVGLPTGGVLTVTADFTNELDLAGTYNWDVLGKVGTTVEQLVDGTVTVLPTHSRFPAPPP